MLILLGLLEYPVFSTMLIFIAGILVAYAVFHPFRADGVAEQIEQVQQQNAALHSALEEQRAAYARLEQKHSEQQFEWAQVRDSQLDLTTAWNQFGQNYSQVSADLQQLQNVSDDAQEMLKHERAERRVAEEALLAAEDKLDEMKSKLERLELDRAQGNALQVRLDDAHAQISRLTEQVGNGASTAVAGQKDLELKLATTNQELQQRANECRQLQEALDSQARELKTAREEASKLRDADSERSNLVGVVGARRKQVAQLEAERDEARANEHRVRRELEKYKSSTLQRDRELDRLRNLENRFTTESRDIEALRAKVAAFETTSAERDELEKSVLQLTAERDLAVAAQDVAKSTMEKVASTTQENRNLKDRCDEALSKLQSEQLSRQKLESKLDESQEELSALRQRCLTLQDANEESAKLRNALEESRRRLQQVTIERDAAFAAESAAKEDLHRHRESSVEQGDVDRIRQQREEVLVELETVRSDRERLQRAVRRQEEQITSLQALTVRLEASQAVDGSLSDRLADQAERLRKVSLEHELNSASLGQAEQTIDELRQLLSARQATIESLQRERDNATRRSTHSTAHDSGKSATASETRRDPRLGMVFIRPPAKRDDLKRISGVGETLETKLNDFGVYTFEQIANWDEATVVEFQELLSFRDRIQRENWIGQARRLQAGLNEKAA